MLPRVLRHRWFAAFTAAVGVTSLGHEFQRLAVPLLVLDLTHSVGAAALLRVVEFLPFIVWGPFAGAIIDRLDRRKVLITCDLGQTAIYASMALAVIAGVDLWIVYVLAFFGGVCETAWALVTDFAVIPSLVGEDELTQANAVYLGTDRGARALGPAAAGLAIASVGIPAALFVTSAAFLATVAVVYFMPTGYRLRERRTPFSPRGLAGEISEGFTFVLRQPVLRALLVLMFIANLGGSGIQTILLFFLREEVRLDASTIGIALSAMGLAAILGAAAAPAIARGRPLGQTMLGIATLAGIGTGLAAVATEWRLVVAAVGARSFAHAAHIVYVFIPRQREIPQRLRGRANGAFRMMLVTANAISPVFLGTIVERAGTSAAFATGAALMFLAAFITYFSPLRRYDIRGVEEEPPAAAEEAEAAE